MEKNEDTLAPSSSEITKLVVSYPTSHEAKKLKSIDDDTFKLLYVKHILPQYFGKHKKKIEQISQGKFVIKGIVARDCSCLVTNRVNINIFHANCEKSKKDYSIYELEISDRFTEFETEKLLLDLHVLFFKLKKTVYNKYLVRALEIIKIINAQCIECSYVYMLMDFCYGETLDDLINESKKNISLYEKDRQRAINIMLNLVTAIGLPDMLQYTFSTKTIFVDVNDEIKIVIVKLDEDFHECSHFSEYCEKCISQNKNKIDWLRYIFISLGFNDKHLKTLMSLLDKTGKITTPICKIKEGLENIKMRLQRSQF